MTDTTATRAVQPSQISYTHWMYALHSLAAVIGISSTAFIATAFVFGIPSIIAVIMNYLKRDEVRGTWLESHFSWQLRTFWYAVWSVQRRAATGSAWPIPAGSMMAACSTATKGSRRWSSPWGPAK